MKTEKFAEQIRAAITKALDRLETAKTKALYWKQCEANAGIVLNRLRTALDALEGHNGSVGFAEQPTRRFGLTDSLPDLATAQPPLLEWAVSESIPEGGIAVILDGEPVVLEPGYEIGRNSFGEECIVPIGYKAPAQPEPTKTTSVVDSVADGGTNFDSPESLI